MNRTDSTLYYARESAKVIKALATFQPALDPGIAYENLYLGFKQKNQTDSAFFYQGLALRTKDTLYNDRINTLVEFQSLSFHEQLRLRELEKGKGKLPGQDKNVCISVGTVNVYRDRTFSISYQ